MSLLGFMRKNPLEAIALGAAVAGTGGLAAGALAPTLAAGSMGAGATGLLAGGAATGLGAAGAGAGLTLGGATAAGMGGGTGLLAAGAGEGLSLAGLGGAGAAGMGGGAGVTASALGTPSTMSSILGGMSEFGKAAKPFGEAAQTAAQVNNLIGSSDQPPIHAPPARGIDPQGTQILNQLYQQGAQPNEADRDRIKKLMEMWG
jgi:hypothetical protein